MTGMRLYGGMLVASLAGCMVDTSDGSTEAAFAASSQELRGNALSNRQQATVLKLVDDICGDTWCEGDHNFSFDRVECRKGCKGAEGSCQLTFRIFSYDTDIDTGPTFARTCSTGAFSGFESLVQTQASHQSLQPAYYDALTECISKVEAELPR